MVGGSIKGLLEPTARYSSQAFPLASVLMVAPIAMKKPNVAPDVAIYCDNVRIIPFGPGPNRIILVAPGKS
jgi:hypothetical protein